MLKTNNTCDRRGVILIKTALLMVPLMGLIAFAVDYGYLLKVRTDLQRTADLTALAAVRDLIPGRFGNQDIQQVLSRANQYTDLNTPEYAGLKLRSEDVQCGRYDPEKIYTSVVLLNDGELDAVRLTIRRDNLANSPVSLFFAPVLGIDAANINATSTAIVRRASTFRAGGQILPMAVPEHVWDAYRTGDRLKIYSNGKLKDNLDKDISGNWGTVDIGSTNNSTSDLSDQIANGLRQSDLDALASDGRIASSDRINTGDPLLVQGETGMSAGMRSAVQAIHGEVRYLPIFDTVKGSGNSAEYNIVRWGAVEVVDSIWNGNNNTWIRVEKTTTYDLDLTPHTDLSDISGTIDGAFTAAVLVE